MDWFVGGWDSHQQGEKTRLNVLLSDVPSTSRWRSHLIRLMILYTWTWTWDLRFINVKQQDKMSSRGGTLILMSFNDIRSHHGTLLEYPNIDLSQPCHTTNATYCILLILQVGIREHKRKLPMNCMVFHPGGGSGVLPSHKTSLLKRWVICQSHLSCKTIRIKKWSTAADGDVAQIPAGREKVTQTQPARC